MGTKKSPHWKIALEKPDRPSNLFIALALEKQNSKCKMQSAKQSRKAKTKCYQNDLMRTITN